MPHKPILTSSLLQYTDIFSSRKITVLSLDIGVCNKIIQVGFSPIRRIILLYCIITRLNPSINPLTHLFRQSRYIFCTSSLGSTCILGQELNHLYNMFPEWYIDFKSFSLRIKMDHLYTKYLHKGHNHSIVIFVEYDVVLLKDI